MDNEKGSKENPIVISQFAFKIATHIQEEVDKRFALGQELEAKILAYSKILDIATVSMMDERSRNESNSFNEYFGIVKQEKDGKPTV